MDVLMSSHSATKYDCTDVPINAMQPTSSCTRSCAAAGAHGLDKSSFKVDARNGHDAREPEEPMTALHQKLGAPSTERRLGRLETTLYVQHAVLSKFRVDERTRAHLRAKEYDTYA